MLHRTQQNLMSKHDPQRTMKDENIGEDWASFTRHLDDQGTFAGRAYWRKKDESGNWPNLCSLFSEE